MVVLGTIHPDRIVTQRRRAAGDVLVLTKPLGIGVITTAIKAPGGGRRRSSSGRVAVMTTLNRAASEAMLAVGGARRHGRDRLRAARPPVRDGARQRRRARGLGAAGAAHRGYARPGRAWPDPRRQPRATWTRSARLLRWAPTLTEVDRLLLADAQTSGGLLIAVAPERAGELVELLQAQGALAAAVVGEITAETGTIEILDQ